MPSPSFWFDRIDSILDRAFSQGRSFLYEFEVYEVLLCMGLNAPSNIYVPDLESFDLTVFLQADNPFPDASLETAYRTGGRPELEHLLADTIQCLTTGTVLFTAAQVVNDVHARQLRRQGVAGLLALARMCRDIYLFVVGFILGTRVGLCQQLGFVEQLKLVGVLL